MLNGACNLQEKRVLLVLETLNEALVLSFRNLPNVAITTAEMLGTYDILLAERLLFTRAGIARLQELKLQPVGVARVCEQRQGGAE